MADTTPINNAAAQLLTLEERRRRGFSYAVAAATVGVVLVTRLSLNVAVAGSSAFLLFMGAVMISAWVGGTGPALFATILSALAGNYFFMAPRWSFGLGTSSEEVEFVLFLIEGTVVALLAGQLHRARDQAVRGQREARELERRILEISDAEQRRIGHDLHDGLGQHLTGISLITKRLEQRLVNANSPEADEATKLSDLARTAVSWTHHLSQALSPRTLETEGLPEALTELAVKSESIFNVRCSVAMDGNIPPTDAVATMQIYRVVQEAITNSVKHGQAKNIQIELADHRTGLVVQVHDNGTGIKRTNPQSRGMGLRIMQYRARMIGATVKFISGQAQIGTTVILELPATALPPSEST